MASEAERLRVYLSCRSIFSSKKAKASSLKKFSTKRIIANHEEELSSLLQDVEMEKVVEIAKDLRKAHVFESELQAKIEFPGLFCPSPSSDEHHKTSEIEAAQAAAEVLDEVASQESGNPAAEESDASSEREEEHVVSETEEPKPEDKLDGATPVERDPIAEKLPSLYPSYLPYKTQHSILATAQQVLEECCFEFAAKAMPDILKRKGWDCPAAGELTKWVRILRRQKMKAHDSPLPNGAESDGENDVFHAVATLRHTAVHRVPTTARGTSKLLESAVKLSQLLQDEQRAEQLDEMRLELDSQISAMELNKNALEDSVTAGLREIQRQREELDRREAELIDGMVDSDLRNKVFVGQLLEDYVKSTFHKGKHAISLNGVGGDTDDPGTKESLEDDGRSDNEGEASEVKGKVNHNQDDHYDYEYLDEITAGIWNPAI